MLAMLGTVSDYYALRIEVYKSSCQISGICIGRFEFRDSID